MIKKPITINLSTGLEERPVAQLGEEITLSANGDDENAAMESIEQYLSNQ